MSEDIVSSPTKDEDTEGWYLYLIQAPLQLLEELIPRPFLFYINCIALYSSRTLSHPEDVLAAFNGVSNLMEEKMGAPFVFGLPSSHFDLAVLWTPRSAPSPREKKRQEFPSWSWCGWKDAALSYDAGMLEGCFGSVHEWLMNHTWIRWHIRDGRGRIRQLWDPWKASSDVSGDRSWQGYEINFRPDFRRDEYGRAYKKLFMEHTARWFRRTIPESPYRFIAAPPNSLETTKFPDLPILQFWTYSAFLRLVPSHQSVNLHSTLVRYDILDKEKDWCGAIVFEKDWVAQQKKAGKLGNADSNYEFIMLSDAKAFTEDECSVWTYYIAKERAQSEWNLYYALLVERIGGLWYRVVLGKVFRLFFGTA